MNKKIVLSALSCTLAIIQLFAMQQGHPLYPDPSLNQHAVAPMQTMQPITIPLQPDSIDYVNRTSKWSALAGACAGLGAGYYVLQNHGHEILQQQTELFRKIAIPTISTILASGAGYCIGNVCATYNTPEKIDQRKANNAIYLHNKMIDASNAVGLNEYQRIQMSQLPFEHFDDRLTVYQGLNISQSTNPVNERVNYAQDKALKLCAEREAANNLGNRPDIFATSSFLENQRDKAATMNANRARINHINDMLSHEKLTQWASNITNNAPEYKTDALRNNLTKKRIDLEQKEESIRYDLARLASLIRCNFSHIHLSSSVLDYVSSSWSTSYSDTPEGRKRRDEDITHTSTKISRATQNYLELNDNYNLEVIDHNNLVADVSVPMKNFITQRGGIIGTLQGRKTNKNLLAYNHYLNHSRGSLLVNWINSCFDN